MKGSAVIEKALLESEKLDKAMSGVTEVLRWKRASGVGSTSYFGQQVRLDF